MSRIIRLVHDTSSSNGKNKFNDDLVDRKRTRYYINLFFYREPSTKKIEIWKARIK